MTQIGLGTSNLWNMRGVNTNLTKKTASEENQNKDEAVKTPVLNTGTPIADLPRVPVGTILANNGVTITTQAKEITDGAHFDSLDDALDSYSNGKYRYPSGKDTITFYVGDKEYQINANGDMGEVKR